MILPLRARDGGDAAAFGAMDLTQHWQNPRATRRYVRAMFDLIAPGYDAFTALFSFGMDRAWKRLLIQHTAQRCAVQPAIADLACGTGDLGFALAHRVESPLLFGLDLSSQMLSAVRARAPKPSAALVLAECDMLDLCLPDACVDVVTVGYGLRNTADCQRALAEIVRVLKPGGVLATLDFHRPANSAWRELFLWYLWNAGRLAGWLWHREPSTYGYLAPSIRRYLTAAEFAHVLAEAGLTVEWSAQRLGGAIALHVARRCA